MTTVEPPSPSAAPVGHWLTPGRFALLLGALVAISYPQVLAWLQSFVFRDYGFFAQPLAFYQRECFWQGELPLWNPYNNCGVPFLAQWNTMPLYPPALIYLVLPLTWGLGLFTLLHLFWAGLGMYRLAARWTGSPLGAGIAGLIFAFNGLSLNLLMWPSHIATLSWMPWVLLAVHGALREGGRKVVAAALAGALQMLAGGPETILFTWLFCVGLALWLWLGRNRGQGPGTALVLLGRLPLIVLLVTALSAAQLLPFLDLAAHSEREAGYADSRWSMPGSGWANFLVPMSFGAVIKGVFFQSGQAWTSSYYLGMATLLLGLLALAGKGDRRAWLLAAAGVAGVFLAFGDELILTRWLRRALPQLTMITYPVKFVILAVFTAPLVAAFGFKVASEQAPKERVPRWLVTAGALLLVLIAIVIGWNWNQPQPGGSFQTTLVNGISRAGLLALISFVLWQLWRSEPSAAPGRRRVLVVPLLVLLLFWLDFRTHVPEQNPTAPPWVYASDLARTNAAIQPQPELGQSRVMVSPAAETQFMRVVAAEVKDNYLVKRLGYFADCNLLDRVPKVNGFFSLYPRQSGDLGTVLYGSTNANFPNVMDFLGVTQVSAPGKFFAWEPRTGAMPLVTAGQHPFYFTATNELVALLATNFDPRTMVILGENERPLVTVTNRSAAKVLLQTVRREAVEAEVEAETAALVVVAQTWYPRWRAYLDGQPVPLLRANYAFQAVEVPRGKHRLAIVYEDRLFRTGAIISGVVWLGCLGVLGRKRKPQVVSGS